jgi:hypothetical protein
MLSTRNTIKPCCSPQPVSPSKRIYRLQDSLSSQENQNLQPKHGNSSRSSRGFYQWNVVYSTDATLLCLYYFENHLHVNDSDLARMFLVAGIVSIVIQDILSKLLANTTLGPERATYVTSLVSGTIHNLLLWLETQTKLMIYVAEFNRFPICFLLAWHRPCRS